MKTSFLLGVAAVAGIAASASADLYTGAGGSLPDFNVTPGTFTSTINVPNSFTVTGIEVTLRDLTHTWVGDLHITLTHGATTVDLVNRIGRVGGSGAGDSSNFNGVYTFVQTGGGNIWTEATLGTSTYNLTSGTYNITTVDGAASSFVPLYVNSSGDWVLTITDNAGGDIGALGAWNLNLVPVPSTAALLGLGGLIAARRRRA